MKALKKYRWPLTGALLGVLVFLAVYGVRVLDPTSVDWILNSLSPDPIQHYLGWELFRRSPVHLPYIGANYNAVYPFRTSVLFTDSLPLAALFFKLLGGILPTRFQYFGWWGLLCYALQGGLAQAVIARIAGVQPTFGRDDKSKAAVAIIMSPGQTAKLWGSVLGAGVLVLFPALTIRMFAHTALAANWLVLLALYLWLGSDELMPTTRRACLIWGGMGLLCAGIHLYYLPMVGLVLVGYAVRRALQKRGPAAVLAPIAAFCAAALAELVLLGAFAVNFAGYSNGYLSGADYFGLFVPWLAQSWEQNVYAGVGTSLAVVLAMFGIVCNARKAEKFFAAHRDWLIAGAVVLVLDLIAAGGNAITVNGKTLFTVPIPQLLMNFWAMFSSCARLAWLAGMLLAVVGCGLVLRFWDNGVAPALMLAVCAVAQGWGQRSELFNRWTDYHYYGFRYENKTLLTDPVWEQIAASGRYSHLAFATFDFEHDEFWDLVDFAADHGVICGVSRPYGGTVGFQKADRSARAALRMAARTETPCVTDDPAGVVRLLEESSPAETDAYIHRQLGTLLRQPEPRRQELLDTLASWLRCMGNQRRMARELHLHYNTVSYRLQQLWLLLEADPVDPMKRLALETALYLYRYRRT